MTRIMIDATHLGLPSAIGAIHDLLPGDIAAGYVTGSPEIIWTPADWATIPTDLKDVMIDQGFTGSPNSMADVRDVENGAWTLANAVNKTGWQAVRPTLYVGFPNTLLEVINAGWKGDVWLVMPSNVPPTQPPRVPAGINVVAIQWGFSNPNFDISVVFDESWPNVATPTVIPQVPPGQWHDPKQWTWQQVQIIGRGLDNVLYTFEYREKTGTWVRISSPPGT